MCSNICFHCSRSHGSQTWPCSAWSNSSSCRAVPTVRKHRVQVDSMVRCPIERRTKGLGIRDAIAISPNSREVTNPTTPCGACGSGPQSTRTKVISVYLRAVENPAVFPNIHQPGAGGMVLTVVRKRANVDAASIVQFFAPEGRASIAGW